MYFLTYGFIPSFVVLVASMCYLLSDPQLWNWGPPSYYVLSDLLTVPVRSIPPAVPVAIHACSEVKWKM